MILKFSTNKRDLFNITLIILEDKHAGEFTDIRKTIIYNKENFFIYPDILDISIIKKMKLIKISGKSDRRGNCVCKKFLYSRIVLFNLFKNFCYVFVVFYS